MEKKKKRSNKRTEGSAYMRRKVEAGVLQKGGRWILVRVGNRVSRVRRSFLGESLSVVGEKVKT